MPRSASSPATESTGGSGEAGCSSAVASGDATRQPSCRATGLPPAPEKQSICLAKAALSQLSDRPGGGAYRAPPVARRLSRRVDPAKPDALLPSPPATQPVNQVAGLLCAPRTRETVHLPCKGSTLPTKRQARRGSMPRSTSSPATESTGGSGEAGCSSAVASGDATRQPSCRATCAPPAPEKQSICLAKAVLSQLSDRPGGGACRAAPVARRLSRRVDPAKPDALLPSPPATQPVNQVAGLLASPRTRETVHLPCKDSALPTERQARRGSMPRSASSPATESTGGSGEAGCSSAVASGDATRQPSCRATGAPPAPEKQSICLAKAALSQPSDRPGGGACRAAPVARRLSRRVDPAKPDALLPSPPATQPVNQVAGLLARPPHPRNSPSALQRQRSTNRATGAGRACNGERFEPRPHFRVAHPFHGCSRLRNAAAPAHRRSLAARSGLVLLSAVRALLRPPPATPTAWASHPEESTVCPCVCLSDERCRRVASKR